MQWLGIKHINFAFSGPKHKQARLVNDVKQFILPLLKMVTLG